MQAVSGERSLWIYSLIFISLQLWGRLSTSSSTSSPSLPAPNLSIHLRTKDSVVLICGVPQGHQGVLFMLYRLRDMVDSQEQESGAAEVQFTVNVKEKNSSQLFCCLYKDHKGRYSAFSPYLMLEQPKEDAPTRSIPLLPPPVLSVEPSTGVAQGGDVLSFNCSVPALPPLSLSGSNNRPATFLLVRTAERTGPRSVLLQRQAGQAPSRESRSGVFTVGPVRGGEDGEYACIYQITKRRQLVNSTVSNVVRVTIKDVLPLPTLLLQQQTDIWHLLCTGSPAYPGAVFSLYLDDGDAPIATQHARVIQHQATFPVPVQEAPVVSYRCQYSVLLGKTWSSSERSQPLAVSRGLNPPSSPDLSGVDWPLVLGSFSAVVLFLCFVALVVVVTRKRVKAAAEEKKKREEAHFWTQDHIVDLTVRPSSFTSQEWSSGNSESAFRASLWNPHSTFTTPIHPIH